MTDRPTISVTLPTCQAHVKLYEYLTTRELRSIRRKLLESARVNPQATEQDFTFSAAVSQDIEEAALDLLVLEITSPEGEVVADKVNFIGDLRVSDGDFLYAKINEIYNSSRLSEDDKKK